MFYKLLINTKDGLEEIKSNVKKSNNPWLIILKNVMNVLVQNRLDNTKQEIFNKTHNYYFIKISNYIDPFTINVISNEHIFLFLIARSGFPFI